MEPGTLVWAKLRGFPWWPGKILTNDNLPKRLVDAPRPKDSLPVIFFGTLDYCFVFKSALVPYEENKEKYGNVNAKNKHLCNAIRLAAEDPSSVDIDFNTPVEDALPSEDENAESQVVYDPSVHTAKKRKRKTSENMETEEKKPKKTNEKTRKEKKEKEKAGQVSVTSGASGEANSDEKSAFDRLLSLRHRLQRIFLTETIKIEEFHRVDALMTQLEEFPVSFELLKETKVGKVIKRIANMNIENEPENLNQRCLDLLLKWRELLTLQSVDAKEDGIVESAENARNVEAEEELKSGQKPVEFCV